MPSQTAVIGAGPAGCYAAYLLQKSGREVVLFESSASIGGRTFSWQGQNWTIDSGAGFFTNFYSTLWPLITELNLGQDLIKLSRSNALTDGKQVADFTVGSLASFANFPFLTARAKIRLAWHTAVLMARYHNLDLSYPASLAAVDDCSIQAEALRLFGEKSYQYLIRPGIEPFWYFSCADVSRSLLLGLQSRAATAEFYTLRRGMASLCERLVARLNLKLEARVEAITELGSQFKLKGHGLGELGDRIFDEVVIATPGIQAASLTSSLNSRYVSPIVRSFLQTQTYAANIHAAFLVDDRSRMPPYSALFPCGPKPSTVAAINFNSHKQQNITGELDRKNEIVSIFLTTQESLAVMAMPDDELYNHCWQEGQKICPQLPDQRTPYNVIRRQEAIPVHAVGRYRKATAVAKEQRPPLVFAGDYLTTATIDGALRSGFEAAALLLAE